MNVNQNKPFRISEIDALRGIAAMAVLFFHYSAFYQIKMKTGDPFPGFDFIVGELGVDLFFMMSGFVILLTAERSRSVMEFAVSRFVRLWPSFFVCCTITTIFLLIYPVDKSPNLLMYLANLSLQPNLIKIGSIDGVYWSLFIEMEFYVIFGIILFFKKIDKAVFIFSIFTAFCIAYQLFLKARHTDNFIHYYIGIVRHAHVFLAGILCYRFMQTKKPVYLVGIVLASVGVLTSHWMRLYSFDTITHYVSYWIFFVLIIYVSTVGNRVLSIMVPQNRAGS